MRRPLARLALVLLVAATAAAQEPGGEPLRFGAVSFYNPRIMYLKYQPLVDYLSVHTGRPWELVVSASYERTVASLCDGSLALAYLGPLTYVRAHEQCGALPVVRLETNGRPTYQASVLVRNDSPFRSLPELRGKRFGFGAPLSTSSHLLPRAMLLAAGLTPGVDVRCTYFWHHERAARAVLLGEVEACGIRDLVGKRFEQRGLRVIASSDPIPNFPLVLGPRATTRLREEVVRALVILPRVDASVRTLMADWDEELSAGFALSSDREFDGIRQLSQAVFGSRYLLAPERDLECSGGS